MKGNDMCREQKIPKGSCPRRDRLEAETPPEVRSMPMRDTRGKNGVDLMRRIVSRENMVQAYKQVRKNGGAPGIDGIEKGVQYTFCIEDSADNDFNDYFVTVVAFHKKN